MKTNPSPQPPQRLLAVLVTTFLLLFLPGGGNVAHGADNKYPGTVDGAKALLGEFLKPGADLKALSLQLRPTAADYEAVFAAPLAQKVREMYEPAWAAGALVISPKPGQTELLVQSVPAAEIRQWSKQASAILPGGYQQIAADIKEGHTIHTFKFVKPGETLGMAFDGLTFVNGQWRIFPKPWRAAAAAPAK